jgi:hypothetical protein
MRIAVLGTGVAGRILAARLDGRPGRIDLGGISAARGMEMLLPLWLRLLGALGHAGFNFGVHHA